MAHDSLAVANKILDTAQEQGRSLTLMQLIKLIYMAHGWSLALLDKPLVDEPVEAWQHGPVYPKVYREFRGSGWMPITIRATQPLAGVPYQAELGDDEISVIDQVVKAYGKLHAFQLSERTHKFGTPWYEVFNNGAGKSQTIPNKRIKAEFDKLKAN